MSYYDNIAQSLQKKDFDWAIKLLKRDKIKYPKLSPIVMPIGYKEVLRALKIKI